METEIESKFLDINKDEIRSLLEKNGGKLIHEERFMKRKVFDYPDNRLQKIGGWVRVRDEGDIITFSYKQLIDRTIEGTKEITVNVDDFDKTCDLLISIGLDSKAYQETKRERWDLDGVEVTIDTWPWIPTFLELEGKDEEELKLVAKKLNIDYTKALHGSVEIAYQKYYNVTEEEIDGWESITFCDIPGWLEIKRI